MMLQRVCRASVGHISDLINYPCIKKRRKVVLAKSFTVKVRSDNSLEPSDIKYVTTYTDQSTVTLSLVH